MHMCWCDAFLAHFNLRFLRSSQLTTKGYCVKALTAMHRNADELLASNGGGQHLLACMALKFLEIIFVT